MNKTELLFLLDINNYINKKIKLNKCSYYEIRDILIFKFYLLDIFKYDASIKKELDDVLVYFYKCVSTNKLSIDLWTGLTGVCMIFREAYKSNLIKDGNFETVEKIIIDAVEKYYFHFEKINHRYYDLFYGLTGIGSYFVELYSKKYEKFINQIIDNIYDTLIKKNKMIITPLCFEDYVKNGKQIDITASHGLIQVLQFCDLCKSKGIINKNIKKIENEIFTIYDFVYHNLSHYQYIQKLDTKFNFSFKLINNYSWNYGSFSVNILLSLLTNEKSFIDNVSNIINNNSIDLNNYNLYFSNGLSGIAYMCYIAEKKEYFSYLSSIKKSIFEEIMNRKGEILNDIDNSNYSIINGAISCTMPILEENSHNFHLFAKMLLLNNFIPEKNCLSQ